MLITASEIKTHLTPLAEFETGAQGEEIFARVAMSHLSEPGDRLAGCLTQSLGFEKVLQLLIARADTNFLVSQMPTGDPEEISDRFGSNIERLWADALERWIPRLSKQACLASLDFMLRQQELTGLKHSLLASESQHYPRGLLDLEAGAPGVLWVLGNSAVLSQNPAIAIVGARVASRYGIEVTRELGTVAASESLVTISGGAFGIDAETHRTATRLGAPTIAYMAGGLGQLYPKAHQSLFRDIAQHGAVVSELPPAVVPAKWRFLMRNRLIAAHGMGTVIVEAGKTSGALRTARYAIELGREVAVVPGPITSAHSAGCHDLLNQNRDEVRLLARPQELLELAGRFGTDDTQIEGLGNLEKRALDAFQSGSLETWEIQRLAGLTAVEVQIALGGLEIRGLVERVGTRYLRAVG